MQAKELIKILEKNPDAHVVVQGEIVHGADVMRGKVEIGYYNPRFVHDQHGKEYAIVFLQNTELSTGEVISSLV